MSDIGAPVAFEMVRRPPSQRTAGLISAISGYREMMRGRFCQREAAPLAVPLIISFGTPFSIALGRDPAATDRQRSFAAGLYAGPVYIESDGGAECVQVDFTPLGAYRFFGGAVVDLAARMVEIDDVLGPEGSRLRERLGATIGWQRRFDIVEDFVMRRANHLPSPELEFAYRLMARSGGGDPDWRPGAGDRLEPQAPRRSLSIRIRSRSKTACADHALPQRLPAGANRDVVRLGRDRGGQRFFGSGASCPRIRSTCRRAADGLGATAGADR